MTTCTTRAAETLSCPRCELRMPWCDWPTRYGIKTCGLCLRAGYVILPLTDDERAADEQFKRESL